MTAPRRPRSAWLLVGSTASRWAKAHNAGQRLSRLLANKRWYSVLLVALPGAEEVAGDPDAVLAEPLLFGHAFAVGGEVPEQVRPAELPLAGVEVVVAAPAVGADDSCETLAEQRPGLEAVAAGCDPEDCALAGQGTPQRPAGAGGLPACLVDVDHRRRLDLLLEPGVGRGERLPGAVDDRVD